jgi:hypothetical protein
MTKKVYGFEMNNWAGDGVFAGPDRRLDGTKRG